jgi:DNA-binding response OmpR family regulator
MEHDLTGSIPQAEATAPSGEPAPGATAGVILLADPDERRRDTYATSLLEAGFEVAAVGDDASAIAAANRALSAIVISHITAAGTADLGLCRQLRAAAATRDVPVIVLTALDDEHTREQIVRAGATTILIEPLKQGLLVRRVRRVITHTQRRRRPH